MLFMHSHGFMHLDVKAANVLVSNSGKVIKLADFGCARSVKESRSSHAIPGTSGFQVQRMPLIPASDIPARHLIF